jgi:hypothetical protein
LRLRLRRSDPPDFHLSRRQRCELSGVNADWHKAVTMQLSQHVHTLPYSVHQLLHFQAGSPEALRLMAGRSPRPPSRTARTMAVWREVAGGPSGALLTSTTTRAGWVTG